MGTSLPHLETILEDDQLLAVVKPAGIPTANAPRGAPSVFAILRESLPAGRFLGVVSRLDAAVSGVLVLAKTRAAAAELSRQFRVREVRKVYGAVVEGRFPAPLGRWVDWHDRIERAGQERRSMLRPGSSLQRPSPKAAPGGGDGEDDPEADLEGVDAGPPGECHVRARVVQRFGEISLVDLEPSTGRRHQLRAQLAGHGCPIVGDRVYGARLPFLAANRSAIALHARSLAIVHPTTHRPLRLTAVWPATWSTRFPGLQLGAEVRAADRGAGDALRVD